MKKLSVLCLATMLLVVSGLSSCYTDGDLHPNSGVQLATKAVKPDSDPEGARTIAAPSGSGQSKAGSE